MEQANKALSESALIDTMWEVMRGDSNFLPMIQSWDALLDGLDGDEQTIHQHLLEKIQTDFERLDTGLELQLAQTSKAFSDTILVVNDRNQVVQKPTSDLLSGVAFDELAKELDFSDIEPQLMWSRSPSSLLVVLSPLHDADNDSLKQKSYRVEISEHVWQDEYATSLQQAFGLSKSELGVLKLVFEGETSEGIAQHRNRSVNTVRAQIKSLLAKTEVSTQRRLVHMVANTFLMLDRIKEQVPSMPANQTSSAGAPKVFTFGEPSAEPVLLISPIIHPSYFSNCESALSNKRLRLIVPSNYDDKPKSVADHSAQIQEQLHTVYQEYRPSKVAGIASGGLWALKFAQELDWDIKEVIQIDTGYPRISMSDFRFLPRDPKRSFLIARHTPRILLAAHKVVANDFFTSADGMDRVLSFFYRGQEFDQSLLNADPEFRLFTERLINYSFEQIEQLVFNVVVWNRDWSDLLTHKPEFQLKAILGRNTSLFDVERFEEWGQENSITTHIEENAGQQSVFKFTDLLRKYF